MGDSFFVNPSKRGNSKKRSATGPSDGARGRETINKTRKRPAAADEDITSESEASGMSGEEMEDDVESESDHETETDKRRRLAKKYLASLETELVDGFDAKDLDEDIIARRLKQDVAENHGRIYRNLTDSRVSEVRKARSASKHLTSVATAVEDAYVVAKDGVLEKWRIGGQKAQLVKRRKLGHGAALDVAVNTANKLVVVGYVGGFSVYSAESLETLREFRLSNNTVLCVSFRRNTNELYVGGSDLRLRTYDLSQWAFVETLHGHQDLIVGVDALSQERCVTVGSRDRTAIFWKIPEESRLTFRGGDTKLAAKLPTLDDPRAVTLEGSLDCCAMLDHQLFVTGGDSGNVSLWSTARKKPVFMHATAHGVDPALTPSQASGEADPSRVEIPPAQPRGITAAAAVPFSNVFFTGSWSSAVHMWALSEDQRRFELVQEIPVGKGIVTGLSVSEKNAKEFVVVAAVSREPRLGRWLVVGGHDRVVTFSISA